MGALKPGIHKGCEGKSRLVFFGYICPQDIFWIGFGGAISKCLGVGKNISHLNGFE